MRKISIVLGFALLAGCGTIGLGTPTEKFTTSLCGEGAIPIPCRSLGEISVPEGGEAIATLVVAIAGSYLTKEANLKSCVFTTYPEAVNRTITVTATAACSLNGVPVSEKLMVSLSPIVASS